MYRNQLLHVELLKFILKKSKYFGYVEIKSFLLSNFPEEANLRERKKMNDFLSFLSTEEYIEVSNRRGIWITQEAGITVARENISAIVKIKPKGVNLVEQNHINNFNRIGIIFSTIFGIMTILLGIYSIYITQNRSVLETKIENLKKENRTLESTKHRNFIQKKEAYKISTPAK